MSWKSVPICEDCWIKENGERVPVRIRNMSGEVENCHDCGKVITRDFIIIFVRREVD